MFPEGFFIFHGFQNFTDEIDGAGDYQNVIGLTCGAVSREWEKIYNLFPAHRSLVGGGDFALQLFEGGSARLRGFEEYDFAGVAGDDRE